MIRWKLVALIVCLVVLVISAFLYFTSKRTPSPATTPAANVGLGQPAPSSYIKILNQASSPTAFATNFYSWYLQGLSRDQHFTTSAEFKSTLAGWLTSDFASNWDAIRTSMEGDPALLSQDYLSSWATDIHATLVSQTPTASTVLVSLGSGAELHKLNVSLVLVNNAWRIGAVTAAK